MLGGRSQRNDMASLRKTACAIPALMLVPQKLNVTLDNSDDQGALCHSNLTA